MFSVLVHQLIKMVTNISLLFVPGLCSISSLVYADLISYLSTTHDIPKSQLIPINLPSCDAIATKAALKPSALHVDVATIRSTIVAQLDLGHDVLLVAHSYGGTPVLYAVSGLWKAQRSASGHTTGVLRAALISSSLALPGHSVAGDRMEWREAHPDLARPDDGARIEEQEGEMFVVPDGIEKVWLSDVAADHPLHTSMKPSALSGVITPAPDSDVRKWNVSYLVTKELDVDMPEAMQMWLIERARVADVEIGVESVVAGHFAMVSKVKEVGNWIVSLLPSA